MKKMKSYNKKGQVFEQMGALAVGIAGLAIALVITYLVISKGRGTMTSAEACADGTSTLTNGICCAGTPCAGVNITDYSTAYNATTTLTSAVDEIPSWVSLVVIAVIGSVILGLVALFRR